MFRNAWEELLTEPLRETILAAAAETSCQLVGGAIRDRLASGRRSRDWDLIVGGDGERIAVELARRMGGRHVRLGGDRFSAHRVACPESVIDIWDRGDTPLDEELARRDLTINSIALDLASEAVYDPMDGLSDLRAGLLRANAPERFLEDPVRTLRLARFALSMDRFRLDPPTAVAARDGMRRLTEVAGERVRQELDTILGRQLDRGSWSILRQLDLLPRLWLQQGPDDTRRALTLTDPEALSATLGRIVDRLTERPDETDLVVWHHAMLLHLLDPSAEGQMRRERWLRGCRERRWITMTGADRIRPLLQPLVLPADELACRHFLDLYRGDWPVAAAIAVHADARPDGANDGRLDALIGLASRSFEEIVEQIPLLSGHDLRRRYGVAPGPAMGRLLDSLRQAQVEGRVRTPSEAHEWIERQLPQLGSGSSD